jgi:hypothetical protein
VFIGVFSSMYEELADKTELPSISPERLLEFGNGAIKQVLDEVNRIKNLYAAGCQRVIYTNEIDSNYIKNCRHYVQIDISKIDSDILGILVDKLTSDLECSLHFATGNILHYIDKEELVNNLIHKNMQQRIYVSIIEGDKNYKNQFERMRYDDVHETGLEEIYDQALTVFINNSFGQLRSTGSVLVGSFYSKFMDISDQYPDVNEYELFRECLARLEQMGYSFEYFTGTSPLKTSEIKFDTIYLVNFDARKSIQSSADRFVNRDISVRVAVDSINSGYVCFVEGINQKLIHHSENSVSIEWHSENIPHLYRYIYGGLPGIVSNIEARFPLLEFRKTIDDSWVRFRIDPRKVIANLELLK